MKNARLKKFDPKKCPYKQLLNHKGEAIVLVSGRVIGGKNRGEPTYRIHKIRHVTYRATSAKGGGKSHSKWDCLYVDSDQSKSNFDYDLRETDRFEAVFGASCFDNGESYPKVIEAMKEYDDARGSTIVGIYFN